MNKFIQNINPGRNLGQDERKDDDPELLGQRNEQIKLWIKIAIYSMPFIFVLDFNYHSSNNLPGSPWQFIMYPFITWVTALISKFILRSSGMENYAAYLFSASTMITSVERQILISPNVFSVVPVYVYCPAYNLKQGADVHRLARFHVPLPLFFSGNEVAS